MGCGTSKQSQYEAEKVAAEKAVNRIKLWHFETGGEVYSSPAVADGVVFFGSNDKKVYALKAGAGDMGVALQGSVGRLRSVQ